MVTAGAKRAGVRAETLRMPDRAFVYDISPTRLDSLVDLEEARAVAKGDMRSLGRDGMWVGHYTKRVVSTLEALQRQIRQLHRDVQLANSARSRSGVSSSLSPMDQVKFLTPEQLGEAVGGAVAAQIEAATRQRLETQIAKTAVTQLINELKMLIGGLCDSPIIPPEAKVELNEMLVRLREGMTNKTADEEGGLEDLFE